MGEIKSMLPQQKIACKWAPSQAASLYLIIECDGTPGLQLVALYGCKSAPCHPRSCGCRASSQIEKWREWQACAYHQRQQSNLCNNKRDPLSHKIHFEEPDKICRSTTGRHQSEWRSSI